MCQHTGAKYMYCVPNIIISLRLTAAVVDVFSGIVGYYDSKFIESLDTQLYTSLET